MGEDAPRGIASGASRAAPEPARGAEGARGASKRPREARREGGARRRAARTWRAGATQIGRGMAPARRSMCRHARGPGNTFDGVGGRNLIRPTNSSARPDDHCKFRAVVHARRVGALGRSSPDGRPPRAARMLIAGARAAWRAFARVPRARPRVASLARPRPRPPLAPRARCAARPAPAPLLLLLPPRARRRRRRRGDPDPSGGSYDEQLAVARALADAGASPATLREAAAKLAALKRRSDVPRRTPSRKAARREKRRREELAADGEDAAARFASRDDRRPAPPRGPVVTCPACEQPIKAAHPDQFRQHASRCFPDALAAVPNALWSDPRAAADAPPREKPIWKSNAKHESTAGPPPERAAAETTRGLLFVRAASLPRATLPSPTSDAPPTRRWATRWDSARLACVQSSAGRRAPFRSSPTPSPSRFSTRTTRSSSWTNPRA